VALILIALSIANHAFWGFFSPGWILGPWWIIIAVVIFLAARRRR
jgi:hypothetical protein